MKQGFTVQLLNKNNGQAVRRKWFLTVAAAQAWLDWQYPHWKEMYDMEIFCDQRGVCPLFFMFLLVGARQRRRIIITHDREKVKHNFMNFL